VTRVATDQASALGASSVSQLLELWAERTPRAVALRYKQHGRWHERSYGALAAEVRQLAAALASFGVGVGGALGVYGTSAPQLLTAALAALRLGAPVVSVAPGAERARLRELLFAPEVKAVLVQGQAELFGLLSPEELSGQSAHGRVLAVSDERDASAELNIGSHAGWLSLGERSGVGLPQLAAANVLAFLAHPGAPGSPAQTLDHASLVAAVPAVLAQDARSAAPDVAGRARGGRHELLLFDGVLGAVQRELGLGLWLGTGGVLNLPEPHGSSLRDLSEIGPSALLAGDDALAALTRAVEARFPASGSWRRRWLQRALEARGAGSLDALLITRPLRRHLGVSRLQHVWVLDGARVQADAQLWIALGAQLRDGRQPAQPSRVRGDAAPAELAGVHIETAGDAST